MRADGKVLLNDGFANVWKIAVNPVWHLPGFAKRLGITEDHLRESYVDATNGMYPQLIENKNAKLFLPPIAGSSIYIFGDPRKLTDPTTHIAARVHDECNGSDTFQTTICTCRPYLAYAVNACIQTAMDGGVGLVIFNRKEGRGLGEVVKLQVYNARAQQPGGDTAENYYPRTKAVAGIEDLRLQVLGSDILDWLGVNHISVFHSMNPEKRNPLLDAGITIDAIAELPDDLVPDDAHVEFAAKRLHGYGGFDHAGACHCEP